MPEYTVVESEVGFETHFRMNGASFDAVQSSFGDDVPLGRIDSIHVDAVQNGVEIEMACSNRDELTTVVERLLGAVPFESIGRL